MWKLSFLVAIWSLWKERNSRCFKGKSLDVNKIADNVKHLVALWVSHLPLLKGISTNIILLNWDVVALSCPVSRRIYPRWHPPPHGPLKLSFDGCTTGNPSVASVGGFIRDEDGNIIPSYSGPAAVCSINEVELLALNIGLRHASRLLLQRLLVEGDSSCVIQWASQSFSPPWYLADIIEEVLQLSGDLNVSFHHIMRSANAEAGLLAKEGVIKLSLIISIPP